MSLSRDEIRKIILEKLDPIAFNNGTESEIVTFPTEADLLKESSYLFYEFKDKEETYLFDEDHPEYGTYVKQISPLFSKNVIDVEDKSNWELINIITEELPFYHRESTLENSVDDEYPLDTHRDPASNNVPSPMHDSSFYQTWFRDTQGYLQNYILLDIYDKLRWPYLNENQYLNAGLFPELANKAFTANSEDSKIEFKYTSDDNSIDAGKAGSTGCLDYINDIVDKKLTSTYDILDYNPMQTSLLSKWSESLYYSGLLTDDDLEKERSVFKLQDVKYELLRRKFAGSSTLYNLALTSIDRQGSFIGAIQLGSVADLGTDSFFFKDKREARIVGIPGITTDFADIDIDPVDIFYTRPVADENCTVIKKYSSIDEFPETGLTDNLYVDLSDEKKYIWDSLTESYRLASDANYIPISIISPLYYSSSTDYAADMFYGGFSDTAPSIALDYKTSRLRDNNNVIDWNSLSGISYKKSSTTVTPTFDQLIPDSDYPRTSVGKIYFDGDYNEDGSRKYLNEVEYYTKHGIPDGVRLRHLDDTFTYTDPTTGETVSYPLRLDINISKVNPAAVCHNFLDINANHILFHKNTAQLELGDSYPYLTSTIADNNSVSLMDFPWLEYIQNATKRKSRVQDEVQFGVQINKYLQVSGDQTTTSQFFGISYLNVEPDNIEDIVYLTYKEACDEINSSSEDKHPKFALIWYFTVEYVASSGVVSKVHRDLVSKITLIEREDEIPNPKPSGYILDNYNVGILPFTYQDITKFGSTSMSDSVLHMQYGNYDNKYIDDIADLGYAKAYYTFSNYDIIPSQDLGNTDPAEISTDSETKVFLTKYPSSDVKSVFYAIKRADQYYWSSQIRVIPITSTATTTSALYIPDLETASDYHPDWNLMVYHLNPYLNFTAQSASGIRRADVWHCVEPVTTTTDNTSVKYKKSSSIIVGPSTETALCNLVRKRSMDSMCNDNGSDEGTYWVTADKYKDNFSTTAKNLNGFYLNRVHELPPYVEEKEEEIVDIEEIARRRAANELNEYVSIYGDNREDDIFNYYDAKHLSTDDDRSIIQYDKATTPVESSLEEDKAYGSNNPGVPCLKFIRPDQPTEASAGFVNNYYQLLPCKDPKTSDYTKWFWNTESNEFTICMNVSFNSVVFDELESATLTLAQRSGEFKLYAGFENDLTEDTHSITVTLEYNDIKTSLEFTDKTIFTKSNTRISATVSSTKAYLLVNDYVASNNITTISTIPTTSPINLFSSETNGTRGEYFFGKVYDIRLYKTSFSLAQLHIINSGVIREHYSYSPAVYKLGYSIYEDLGIFKRVNYDALSSDLPEVTHIRLFNRGVWDSILVDMHPLTSEEKDAESYQYQPDYLDSNRDVDIWRSVLDKDTSDTSYILSDAIQQKLNTALEVFNSPVPVRGDAKISYNHSTTIPFKGTDQSTIVTTSLYPVEYKNYPFISSGATFETYQEGNLYGIRTAGDTKIKLPDVIQSTDGTLNYSVDLDLNFKVNKISDLSVYYSRGSNISLDYNTGIDSQSVKLLHNLDFTTQNDHILVPMILPRQDGLNDSNQCYLDRFYLCGVELNTALKNFLNANHYYTEIRVPSAYSESGSIKYSNKWDAIRCLKEGTYYFTCKYPLEILPFDDHSYDSTTLPPYTAHYATARFKIEVKGTPVTYDSSKYDSIKNPAKYYKTAIAGINGMESGADTSYLWNPEDNRTYPHRYFNIDMYVQDIDGVAGLMNSDDEETYTFKWSLIGSNHLSDYISLLPATESIDAEESFYRATLDRVVNTNKIYFTRALEDEIYTYTQVTSPVSSNISNYFEATILSFDKESLDNPLGCLKRIPLFLERSYNTPFFIAKTEKTTEGVIYNPLSADDDIVDPITVNPQYGTASTYLYTECDDDDLIISSIDYYATNPAESPISNDLLKPYYNSKVSVFLESEAAEEAGITTMYTRKGFFEKIWAATEEDVNSQIVMAGRTYKLLFDYTSQLTELSFTDNYYHISGLSYNMTNEEKQGTARITSLLDSTSNTSVDYMYLTDGLSYAVNNFNITGRTSGFETDGDDWKTMSTTSTDPFYFGNPYSRSSDNNYILKNKLSSKSSRQNINNSYYFAYLATNVPSGRFIAGTPYNEYSKMFVLKNASSAPEGYVLNETSMIRNFYSTIKSNVLSELNALKGSICGLFTALSKITPHIQCTNMISGQALVDNCYIDSDNYDLYGWNFSSRNIPSRNNSIIIQRRGVYSNNLIIGQTFDDSSQWLLKDSIVSSTFKNKVSGSWVSDSEWQNGKDVYKISFSGLTGSTKGTYNNTENPIRFEYLTGAASIYSKYESAINLKCSDVNNLKVYAYYFDNTSTMDLSKLTEDFRLKVLDNDGEEITDLENNTWYTFEVETSESLRCNSVAYIFVITSTAAVDIKVTKAILRKSSSTSQHYLGLSDGIYNTAMNGNTPTVSILSHNAVVFRHNETEECVPVMFNNLLKTVPTSTTFGYSRSILTSSADVRETFINRFRLSSSSDNVKFTKLRAPWVQRMVYDRNVVYSETDDQLYRSVTESVEFHEYAKSDNASGVAENPTAVRSLYSKAEVEYSEEEGVSGITLDVALSSNKLNTLIGYDTNLLLDTSKPLSLKDEKFSTLINCFNVDNYKNGEDNTVTITNLQLLGPTGDDNRVLYEFEYLPIVYNERTQHFTANLFLHKPTVEG